MPITRSSSDLQRNIGSIYELCRETKEPVYITRNGHADLVVMDAAAYEAQADLRQRVFEREMRLRDALVEARLDITAGRGKSLAEVRSEMGLS